MSEGKHARSRRRRWPFIVAGLVVVLLVAGAGSAVAAYRYDSANRDLILPGVRIGGVEVGGMSRDEAVAAVQTVADAWLSQPIKVTAAKESWNTTPGQLGVSADPEALVDQAMALSEDYSWVSRVLIRATDREVDATFDIDYALGKGGGTPAFVKELAATVEREPVDAMATLGDRGQAVFRRSRPGREIDPVQSVRAIRETLRNHDRSVALVMRSVKPKVSKLDETIVVDLSENRLYLYDGFKVDRTYRVATASPNYETPLGEWSVINKAQNPTWVNPAPNGWGAGEPAKIGPGPGNPLGTRAIYLDAPGIRIHGTYDDGSIGTYASHGCIRMHIPEVEELYPDVPVGTKVLIVP